jgi:hypothetical protein
MSFEQFNPGQFPTNGQGEAGTPQIPGQDGGVPGQNNGAAGQPLQFPTADGSTPPGQGQPGSTGEQKTTLWYGNPPCAHVGPLTKAGWVNSNHGSTRTLCAISGFRWASKSALR